MIAQSLSSHAKSIMERVLPVASAVAVALFGVIFGTIKAATPGEQSHKVAAPSDKVLIWVDREGKEERIPAPPDEYRHPRISPDGMRIAVTVNLDGAKNREIRIWDLVRKTMTRFAGNGGSPVWTPDGKRIVFVSDRNGEFVLFGKAVDGSGEVEQLVSARDRLFTPFSWSGDGKSLVVYEAPLNLEATRDIGILSVEGNRSHILLLHDRQNYSQPRISPNGRWIAYTSDESGRNEVFVRPYPQVSKGKWQISTRGADAPLWSPDGRELFFRSSGAVIGVPVISGPTFRFDKQRILFRGNYFAIRGHNYQTFDISPDGKKFLMMKIIR